MTQPLFQGQGVTLQRGERTVLSDLDFELPRHRWTCVVGPNGVGKSTLLRALAGLLPVRGRLSFEGDTRFVTDPAWRATRMAWLGQAAQEDAGWRVGELALMGRYPHGSAWHLSSAHDEEVVNQVLQGLDLLDLQSRRLDSLSAGQRQRARMARLLCTQAPTLLLDEPVTHLDPPHQADWLAWAKQWVAQGGHLVTVLHELPLALQADHLVVLHQGRCLHQGAPAELATREAVAQAFDGRIEWVNHKGQWLSAWRS
jgi:iron complex transport system ATP-binding protein